MRTRDFFQFAPRFELLLAVGSTGSIPSRAVGERRVSSSARSGSRVTWWVGACRALCRLGSRRSRRGRGSLAAGWLCAAGLAPTGCAGHQEELGRLHATQEAQSVAVLVHVRVVVFVRCIYVRCVREQGHCLQPSTGNETGQCAKNGTGGRERSLMYKAQTTNSVCHCPCRPRAPHSQTTL